MQGDGREQKHLAQLAGLLPDAMAEQINEAALELWGDIAVEADEHGVYRVIEDYLDEVKQRLNM